VSAIAAAALDISDRFARVALQRAKQLVEQERATLTASPRTLAVAAVAAQADEWARLSRTAAALYDAVDRGDRSAAGALLPRL